MNEEIVSGKLAGSLKFINQNCEPKDGGHLWAQITAVEKLEFPTIPECEFTNQPGNLCIWGTNSNLYSWTGPVLNQASPSAEPSP